MSENVACRGCRKAGPPTARWLVVRRGHNRFWFCAPECEAAQAARVASWTPPPGSFAALLRQRRQHAGLFGRALGRAAGFDDSFISRLELGERTPTRDTVERLARALGLQGHDRAELLVAAGYVPEQGTVVIENGRLIAVTGLLEAQPARDGAA
jgi:transcriptional regulator with XRE-family HTH domain